MNFYPTAHEMSAIDSYTINEIGIPQMVLMEKASMVLLEEVKNMIDRDSSCLIVVEGGNNGGDGVCLARNLILEGYKADVLWIDGLAKYTEAFLLQKNIAEKCGVNFIPLMEIINKTSDMNKYKLIVDGIFGIGLKRNIEGIQKDVITVVNSLNAKKMAIDIPSGINSDTGEIMGTAIKADVTVTFGYKKLGMLFSPGQDYCGRIIVRDIGFPDKARDFVSPKHYSYTHDEIISMLPPRKKDSHKGSYGRVVVIAGSKNMCGAARFAAEASYRTGAGLVRVYTEEENREILQESLPEAMLTTYDKKHFEEDEIEKLKGIIEWADVICAGPGMGTDKTAEKIIEVLMMHSEADMVLDADAINILSKHREWLKAHKGEIVITPHLKEMQRLININKENEEEKDNIDISYIKKNKVEVARSVSLEYNIVSVLKDAVSVVACMENDMTYMNTTGNSGMSKGGSGDVLSGIITGLMAQHLSPYKAACMGCYIHGLAGDIAEKEYGEYSMCARDIINNIARAVGRIK